jgi:hypothetical protein
VISGTTVTSIEQIPYPVTPQWLRTGTDLARFFLRLAPLRKAEIHIPGHFAGKNDTLIN